MKLLYTDIGSPLTALLTKEAESLVVAGKRVFYIAPNSLSFEKERKVLSLLSNKASFAITITRFAQMARYFVLEALPEGNPLDDIGLGMLFFKVLSDMDEADLRVYGRIKTDAQFIQQLLELYHELQDSQMTFADLQHLQEEDKKADFIKIFQAVEEALGRQDFNAHSKLTAFARHIQSGSLDEELSQLALVIDGFTRFSAEEKYLIDLLHAKGVEIVIGVYASQKAYRSPFREGNLYQASVDFLRQLAEDFQVKPLYLQGVENKGAFSKISKILESRYDFSDVAVELSEQERSQLQIWSTVNQKEELEYVAKAIRQKLHDGVRYKDIRLLLGDVEAYRLQLKTIFDQYQIPFYLGRSESIAQHPIVQFMESLLRLQRYRYQADDLLNLLKTGLYGDLSQEEQDLFEQYVRFADLKGLAKFSRDFVHNAQQKFDLERLNKIRQRLMAPLIALSQSRSQTATGLLKVFKKFLTDSFFTENLRQLFAGAEEQEKERQEEVWKSFCHVLEQFASVFATDKVKLVDFLELLQSGLFLSNYRTIPATVDVVTVQSYDLIEPMSSPYVFAIGLTQDYFPKIAQNKSLLTDEERFYLNEQTHDRAELQVASKENLKKNRFAALSLLNSAEKELVLSTPQIVNEVESNLSPYLAELHAEPISLPILVKRPQASSDDIGTYRALLARVIELYQGDIEAESSLTAEEQTFWTVVVRVLRKKLAKEGIEIPAISQQLTTEKLSQQTLQTLYPAGQTLTLSSSALTEFYKNQYAYYLKYVLGLQEELSIHPDARSHGNFLHRIFEKVLQDKSNQSFDSRLQKAIVETSQEADFEAVYSENAQSNFIREILLDTAQATGRVLAVNDLVETIREEAVFGKGDQPFLTLSDGRGLVVRGKVDRVDRLKSDGSLGIVDYKSGEMNFNFQKFFNGLHSQLPTYLSALEGEDWAGEKAQTFGAMYLQMTDPIVSLSKIKETGQAVSEAMKSLEYKGLFLADQASQLSPLYQKNKLHLLSQEELATLLAYNALLYRRAAEQILQGEFHINPYTENGRSIAPYVEQYKAITGFEANLHLGLARSLAKLDLSKYDKKPTGEKLRQAWIEKMKEELEK